VANNNMVYKENNDVLTEEDISFSENNLLKKNDDGKKRIPFAVVEAYKRIRTNMTFLLSQSDENHTIIITSANAGEGKSTTSANLAVAFSQLEKKVLIVDADMRRATLHKKFKMQNESGLSNVLSGMTDVKSAVKSINKNLFILTAGDTPPNPSELLNSKRFSELLDVVNKEYDLVIIDTPPLNIVSDALVIAPNTVGVILVIHDGITPHFSIRKAIESIEFSGSKLLGTIMNGSYADNKGRYSYRKYKYNSYYGYDSKRKARANSAENNQ